jgi:glutamate dehydrogenase (NAD(P)+)
MANVDTLRARLVIQGANIPISAPAEERLHQRGVLNLPDFIVNAGGVICAAVEYGGGTQAMALQTVDERIRRNTRAVLESMGTRNLSPRQAAMDLARTRVVTAMSMRRFN